MQLYQSSCYLTGLKERSSCTMILANQDFIDTHRNRQLEPKPAATAATSDKPEGSFRFGKFRTTELVSSGDFV